VAEKDHSNFKFELSNVQICNLNFSNDDIQSELFSLISNRSMHVHDAPGLCYQNNTVLKCWDNLQR